MSKQTKIFKIIFITQLRQLYLPVKFPCQIKVIWKRSNQTAQSKLVNVVDGIAKWDKEILKLKVSMYFQPSTGKFQEKKCSWSFAIITDKGEKAAGSVVYDLSQFFNNRIYEVQKDFQLAKCPIKDSKVSMKVWYQQSDQPTNDTLSTASKGDLDSSVMSALDASQVSRLNKQSDGLLLESSSKPSSILLNTDKEDQTITMSMLESHTNSINSGSKVAGSPLAASNDNNNLLQHTTSSIVSPMNRTITNINDITLKIGQLVQKAAPAMKNQLEALKKEKKDLKRRLEDSQNKVKLLESTGGNSGDGGNSGNSHVVSELTQKNQELQRKNRQLEDQQLELEKQLQQSRVALELVYQKLTSVFN